MFFSDIPRPGQAYPEGVLIVMLKLAYLYSFSNQNSSTTSKK